MTQLDIEQARFNMVEQQIRPWEVLDQRVLDVITGVPREAFVPERYRQLAFADCRIPIGHGQVMMNPNVEGRLLQAVQIEPRQRVLEVGTGSGYLSACLARLGGVVTSVEIVEQLSTDAAERLRANGIEDVALEVGDAALDWPAKVAFDVIALTGSLPTLGDAWRQRMAINGRLFAIVGDAPIMEAVLVTRTGEREWLSESLFDTEIPPLTNSGKKPEFEF